MVSPLFFYQLTLIALVWLCLMLHGMWPSNSAACPTIPQPLPPRRTRPRAPTPFAGLTTKPPCDACAHATDSRPPAPSAPPPRLVPPRGRRRQVDTSTHFCPNPDCAYQAHGGPWRQLLCVVCRRSFLETLGTLLHGTRASVERIVRVIACLAEGWGIRDTLAVFGVEAAEQLHAFSRHGLHDVRVRQVQLDALFTLLSAVKDGEVSAADASARLERTPQWVWVAMDPERKLLLALDVGSRTLARAQRVVHHVAQVFAPDCAPLFLTDGFRESLTALLTHYGSWVPPPRRQDQGPAPKSRWMPVPRLLYAQVVKTVRRRRLVRVRHRVACGSLETVKAVLAPLGWQSNTAFVERLNLTMRQHIAAVGRRVSALCKGEDGLQQQLSVFHCYANFCLPHTSVRQSLPQPEPTNGSGSATQWRPWKPAMAAGLTAHVWSVREMLFFRVPPWPQPAGV